MSRRITSPSFPPSLPDFSHPCLPFVCYIFCYWGCKSLLAPCISLISLMCVTCCYWHGGPPCDRLSRSLSSIFFFLQNWFALVTEFIFTASWLCTSWIEVSPIFFNHVFFADAVLAGPNLRIKRVAPMASKSSKKGHIYHGDLPICEQLE